MSHLSKGGFMMKVDKTRDRKYALGVINEPILSKLKVDVPELEKLGYNVQRRELWHCDIVCAKTGETALEIVILPDTVVVWNKEKFLCSTDQVHVTVKEEIPVAETSKGLIWETTVA